MILVAVAAMLAMTCLGFSTVSAHEHRDVGDYTFVVGFVTEPAIAGDTNGISLSVTKGDTPVEGLTDTLKATVMFGDQSKDMTLTPVFNTPGSYRAMFIPTAAGDYTFHFTGTIEGTDVDETFTSSPDGFDSVAERSDYEFPVSANGSSSSRDLAMPSIVGAVVLALGAAILLRRRVIAQA
jgi:hypothetical protein